jgi:hypothetical protein
MSRVSKRQSQPKGEVTPGRSSGRGLASQELRFTRVNGLFAVAGVVTLALGYYLLSLGSITAAPLLLVLAYAVLIPLAIIL